MALILDAFARFDPRAAECAERVFREHHIDSLARPGKHPLSGCATAHPQQTPWVILSFGGSLRDVTAMAHELGHAVRSMLSRERSVLTQRALAAAGRDGLRLLPDAGDGPAHGGEPDPRARQEMLTSAIDDVLANVVRQAYLALFEQAAHAAAHAGEGPDALDEIYRGLLAEQFGPDVEIGEEFCHEWLTLSQIVQMPFYSYAHAFGQLLSIALYERYRPEGQAFAPPFLELLARGGSAAPHGLLALVDVDIADGGFWEGGPNLIAKKVAALEVRPDLKKDLPHSRHSSARPTRTPLRGPQCRKAD